MVTLVIMQAYYRIQTRTPSGAIRCLTQPLDSGRTTFQDCLINPKDNTQTFYIDSGKELLLVQLIEGNQRRAS
jgi:hypothetical protein